MYAHPFTTHSLGEKSFIDFIISSNKSLYNEREKHTRLLTYIDMIKKKKFECYCLILINVNYLLFNHYGC